MKLTAKDYKAIDWYCKTYDLKPQLSAPPTMYFTRRDSGEEVRVELPAIILEWSAWNEADQKERARQRQQDKMRSAIRKAL